MKKIQDLLFDLEKKVESSLTELSKLKNEKNDLLDKNQILVNEKNELNEEFRLLDERFKALKIANTISGSENNINETSENRKMQILHIKNDTEIHYL